MTHNVRIRQHIRDSLWKHRDFPEPKRRLRNCTLNESNKKIVIYNFYSLPGDEKAGMMKSCLSLIVHYPERWFHSLDFFLAPSSCVGKEELAR